MGSAIGLIEELERSTEPVARELNELQVKMNYTKDVEQLSERVKEMEFKLAWSWVYEVDKELTKQSAIVEEQKMRLPICQEKIDQSLVSPRDMII